MKKNEDSLKNSVKTQSVLAFIIVFILASTYFYSQGYRISDNFKVVKAGSLRIEVPLQKTEIFINGKRKMTTKENNEVIFYRHKTPGTYTVIASKEGAWPWSKEIKVLPEKTAHARVFQIPSDMTGVVITKNDPDYYKILTRISDNFIPNKNRPRVSSDGNIGIYAEESSIKALWLGEENEMPDFFCVDECKKEIEIIKVAESVRNLDFYKGRNDVAIFASGVGIYAIDLDRRKTQNFQPVYKGINEPFFAKNENELIYVRDGELLVEIVY